MEIAVLGATEEGRAVAGHCVAAGHVVHLFDDDANVVMDAIDAVEHDRGADATERVDGTTDLDAAVDGVDLVVDATDEDESARRDLVASAEEVVGEDAVVAASGAALSVTAVAAGLRRPERAVGLHFVPTHRPTVVEVVVADQTTAETLDRVVEFVEGLDGTPLVVRDAPGFACTRLDLALIVEAVRVVEEGVASVEDVDRALELGRDHPVGPLALADEVGLDRVLAALEDLANRLDGRFDPPGLLREKVDRGALGKGSGEGFYRWEDGERVEPAEPDPTVETRSEVPDRPGDR